MSQTAQPRIRLRWIAGRTVAVCADDEIIVITTYQRARGLLKEIR